MTVAGELIRSVTFQRRSPDANGEALGPWIDVATRSAKIVALKGGEAVQGARLEGTQPVIITVRRCRTTRAIDNSFRAFDAHQVAELVKGGATLAAAIAASSIWGVTSATWSQADDMMEFLALQRRNGSDA